MGEQGDTLRTVVSATDTSFHAVRRRLSNALRDTAPLTDVPRALELSERGAREAPALREAELLEGRKQAARRLSGDPEARFDAFLDGSQLTLVAHWVGPVPVVHGTVSAVIRRRLDRRLTTWRAPIVRHALYAPVPLLSRAAADALDAAGVDVVDTMAQRDPDTAHPFALQDLAYLRVLADRERVEQELAEQWVAVEDGLLFIDGGIAGSAKVAAADNVVGVVKTHQTLHAAPEDLQVIAGLAVGERTGVVRIAGSRVPRARSRAVASWYLRTASAAGRDPFFGLVRIEVALATNAQPATLTKRADDVSRWVLAERTPLAIPDPRWDRMAYGIRDAEEYLRAVQ